MGVKGLLGVLRSGWRRFAEIRTRGRRRPCGRQSCSDRRGACCSPRSRATQRRLPHPAGQLGRLRRPFLSSGRRPLSRAGMDRQGRTGRRRIPRQRRVPGCATGSRGSWGCTPASTSREGPEDRAFWIQAGGARFGELRKRDAVTGRAQTGCPSANRTAMHHAWAPLVRSEEPSFTNGDRPVFHPSLLTFRIFLKGGPNDQSSDRRRPPVGGAIHEG
jgi:hypothetical protein